MDTVLNNNLMQFYLHLTEQSNKMFKFKCFDVTVSSQMMLSILVVKESLTLTDKRLPRLLSAKKSIKLITTRTTEFMQQQNAIMHKIFLSV